MAAKNREIEAKIAAKDQEMEAKMAAMDREMAAKDRAWRVERRDGAKAREQLAKKK